MFDIGAGEFIALAIVALIVLGPEKLPRYAAEAARMLARIREVATSARDDVRRELGPEFQDISFGDLNPRSLVRKHLLDPIDIDSIDPFDAKGDKPAARRGPGEAPVPPAAGPAPYDPDTT